MSKYRRAYVEISNICNLKCSFCPEVERGRQVMSPETFKKIAAQLGPLVDEVCLHLMGEPLGHPHLEEILAACARHALPVNLTTNGLLLTGKRPELLLEPVVRQVNVSVHSFAANFGDASPQLDKYLERVFAFTRLALTRRPDLYVNYRIWDLDQPSGALDQEVRRRIEAEFGTALPATPDPRRRKHAHLVGRVFVNFDSRFTWPSPSLPVRAERGFCHGLSSHFGVHADGKVVPCCLDKEAVLALGDATQDGLATILSGTRAARIRDGFARGELVEDLCRRCPFVARFDRKAQRIRATALV